MEMEMKVQGGVILCCVKKRGLGGGGSTEKEQGCEMSLVAK